jgi:hypothetical protein
MGYRKWPGQLMAPGCGLIDRSENISTNRPSKSVTTRPLASMVFDNRI